MSEEMRFSVFCLENYKAYRKLSGRDAIKLFEEYKVFDYLHEFYDVLHTTGCNYMNQDIDQYLRNHGAPELSKKQ